ncbi:protein brawnin [Aethina tumida]|uniref:protein brawnin n=1 Tax=Aethina tumida TaxID=116153 RepID=UPI00096B51DE|nr:protein brawnin [Aethina tumida]
MPAGVSWSRYLKFFCAAFLSMAAGSQAVHLYYRPLEDIDKYVEKELKSHGKG